MDNHDTKSLQPLEALVEDWFKPLDYTLILFFEDNYPCVFYPDLFGTAYRNKGKDGTV